MVAGLIGAFGAYNKKLDHYLNLGYIHFMVKPMSISKEMIITTALELLAKHERLADPQLFVTAEEVTSCMRVYKQTDCSESYVAQVLDGEFQSRFNGRKIIYFLRLKD